MTEDWTFDSVQTALIEGWQLMQRWQPASGAGGGSGYVMGLWSMVPRDQLRQGVDSYRPTHGLSSREVDRMNVILGWLDLLRDEDRRLVAHALHPLAEGYSRISWTRISRRRGFGDAPSTIKMRYRRALECIAAALNVGAKTTISKSIL